MVAAGYTALISSAMSRLNSTYFGFGKVVCVWQWLVTRDER